MGINLSSVCCSCCSTKVTTEEDDFQGIRSEVKYKLRDNLPIPFQNCLYRLNSEESLHFISKKPQINYLTNDIKELHCSAILDINEIPRLPTPNKDQLQFPIKPSTPKPLSRKLW